MAESRTYTFIIKNQTDSGKTAVASSTPKTESKPQNTEIGNKDILAAGLVAYHKVMPWVNQIVGNENSMVELRTGATEEMQKVQFGWQIASGGLGIAASIATGFAVGNVPGAIIGAVVSIGHKAIDIAQNYTRLNTQKTLENRTLTANYIRAGARGTRANYE